ncbi:hypothetical protein [Parasutterella excrementihominis]
MPEATPKKGRPRLYEGGAKRVTISLPSRLVEEFRKRGSAWVVKKLDEELKTTKSENTNGN